MATTISSGTTQLGYNLSSSLVVCDDGILNDTHIGISGNLIVSSGGIVNNTAVIGNYRGQGTLTIASGGIANDTIVSNAQLKISSGGVATEIRENGGYVYLANGATATFVSNSFSGLVLRYSSATLHSGTTANLTTVTAGGNLHISVLLRLRRKVAVLVTCHALTSKCLLEVLLGLSSFQFFHRFNY